MMVFRLISSKRMCHTFFIPTDIDDLWGISICFVKPICCCCCCCFGSDTVHTECAPIEIWFPTQTMLIFEVRAGTRDSWSWRLVSWGRVLVTIIVTILDKYRDGMILSVHLAVVIVIILTVFKVLLWLIILRSGAMIKITLDRMFVTKSEAIGANVFSPSVLHKAVANGWHFLVSAQF